jgi:2-succinyl-5-enolpyruvyl-6-hydroxy-3-cyclohexene-1-carboxylate synthase
MSAASNLHIAWAELLLRSLALSGVRNVVVSPGSRSTPLVLAAAKEIQLNSRVIVDERSAAFFALGQARASGIPTALICTSGTAAAHYFPAIIEASLSFVPLLVVSADRPWEDRDTGASQTIDQVKMFGDYVRHFADVGPPDASAFRAVARIAAQCVHATISPTPGPVQLNAQFRKPLEPVAVSGAEAWQPALDEILRKGPPKMFPVRLGVDDDLDFLIGAAAGSASRGLIVCGPSVGDESIAAPLFDLARELRFPILAECTSNVRFGNAPHDVVVAGGFDTYFRSTEFRRAHPATFALELGAAPTSAGYAAYVAEHRNLRRFIVHPHAHADPRGDAEAIGHAPIAAFLRAVRARLSSVIVEPRSSEWLDAFARAERITWSRAAEDTGARELNEAAIARAVVAALPDGGTLVVGNSNPVRDLDTFAPPKANAFNVVHQRGAAGIDGLVSGAAGYASIVPAPTILYVGDLTLLHDLAGFAALRHVESPLVIVFVHNGGGRIFEELPLYGSSAPEATFEKFFATAQDVDFEKAAACFGIRFHRANDTDDLARALHVGLEQKGCTLVEARVAPHDGSARRKKFRADVARLLGETST